MRHRITLLVLAWALAGACASGVNVEQERQALLQRDRDWAATTKDVDRFLSFLTADAVVYPSGMPAISGTDNVRTMFTQMTSDPGFSLTWTPATADVSASGDLAVTTGTYELASAAGSEAGKYVTTWRKLDGVWRVTHDIFNPSGPGVPKHAMVQSRSLVWGNPPPGLPAGGKVAVVSGDPGQPMPFVLRLQVPAGYKIGPHWHPTTENVTVLSGAVALGMGDTYDPATMTELGAGGYAVLPTEQRHSFLAKTAATVQVHGIGPFAITYVNSADDPRNANKP